MQTLSTLLVRPRRLLLGLCAAILLALIATELWTTFHAVFHRPAAGAQARPATPGQSDNRVEQITGADLFGHSTAPGPSQEQQLPETSAQLTLRGVFAARDPSEASAIIETGDGHAQIVKPGASVAPDTVLREVHADRVVLSRNGAMENLYFPSPQDNTSGLSPAPGPDNGAAATAQPNASSAPGGGLTAEQKRANILRRLEELRMRNSQ
jgi:general secretion pathway protein C